MVLRTRITMAAMLYCLFAASAIANPIGFETSEGYVADANLYGQPPTNPAWLGDDTSDIKVDGVPATNQYAYVRTDVGTAGPKYVHHRFVPVVGTFVAEFSIGMTNVSDSITRQSRIALGAAADGQWGPYFGINADGTSRSLAHFDGDSWTNIYTGLTNDWNLVRVVGDCVSQTFDVYVNDMQTPAITGLSFRDDTTELSYVMLSNDGSSNVSGSGNYHCYDNLSLLVPEPTAIIFLLVGVGALRRRG